MTGFTIGLISIDLEQISPIAQPDSMCVCQNVFIEVELSNGGLVCGQLIYGIYIPGNLFSLHFNAVVDLVKTVQAAALPYMISDDAVLDALPSLEVELFGKIENAW